MFTFWRCHEFGLFQEVEVVEGAFYRLTAYAHSWYSRCSSLSHLSPLEADCVTPIGWAHDFLAVGIGPNGELDPRDVTWSEPVEVYSYYDDEPLEITARAKGGTATFWLRATATHPLKHNDFYLDDVRLERRYLAFLPLAKKNQ